MEYKEKVIALLNSQELSKEQKEMLETIFPELKESEDERIRKALVEMVHDTTGDSLWIDYNVHKEDALAWLEKQGEQEPADKVETKFHEGEWITNGDYTWKIVEVKPLDYILQSQDGNIVDDTISHVDEQFHSFAIEDAKDGDVLFIEIDASTCIFKKFEENLLYSYIISDGKLLIEDSHYYYETSDNVHPATKEERDLLFAKMKEAGYEWDSEKKELKKAEQKQVITYPDNLPKDNWELIHEFVNKFGRIPKDEDELNALVEYVLKRQKPAKWSEEDEKTLKEIITDVRFEGYNNDLQGNSYRKIRWLKSLKGRVQLQVE